MLDKRTKKEIIQQYYDTRAACYVLSCLLKSTRFLKSKERPLNESYFIMKLHKSLYIVIENLYKGGLDSISLGDIETYLKHHDQATYNRFFEVGDETGWILDLLDKETDEVSYNYYYDILRKFAFLRAKMEAGQDITDILDMTITDVAKLDKQYSKFTQMTIQDLIQIYDRKNMEVKSRFVQRNEEDSRKAGDNAEELFESLQQAPDMGWRHAGGQMMDTISRGCRRGMLTIESRESGCGKTRQGIKQCCMLSCDTLWDYNSESFKPNPFGDIVPTLYIGTEMKLYEEIEPIIWSCISGVEEDKIRSHKLTKEEIERVKTAIEISKRSEIYLENEPDYTCAFIEYKVEEYKVKYNIGALIFDYIELIPPLTAEYVQLSNGVAAREDMVLLHLSTRLKNLANRHDIYIHAFTQIANDARKDETIRDSGAIKGSKSLQARADLGVITMRPTHKELTALKPILDQYGYPTPNLCFNVYKNRGGVYVMVKIWSVVNLGNMHIENLFATNWYYQRMKVDKLNTIKMLDEFIYDEETGEVIEKVGKQRKQSGFKKQ